MSDFATMGLGTDNPFLGMNNPYLQQMIDSTSGDVVRNYNLTARPTQNAAMVRSGSFGNSGLQELQNNQDTNLQGQLGQIASQMRGQDYQQQQQEYNWQKQFGEGQRQFDESTRRYEQNFGRDTFNDAYAQNMGNLQVGVGLLGTMGGYNALDWTNASAEQNAPMNYYNQFANTSSQLGGLGGSATQVGGGSNPLLGALGGAQLANSWWNNRGGSSGSGSPQMSQSDASNADNWFARQDAGGWGGNWA